MRNNFVQFHHILVPRQLNLAQLSQGSNLAAQQILSDRIIYFLQVDNFDCHFVMRRMQLIPQIYITSSSPTQ